MSLREQLMAKWVDRGYLFNHLDCNSLVDLIIEERASAWTECREAAAKKADEYCNLVTRLCGECNACLAAEAIRALEPPK